MRIGLFCSGGDAPGMNPCVRAVVRATLAAGHESVGILRGYQGLLDEDFFRNDAGDVVVRLCRAGSLHGTRVGFERRRFRQFAPVDFAVGCQRQLIQFDERARYHVLGQFVAEMFTELFVDFLG